jgi:thioredoxin-like negative regulator of GroEL
MFRRKRHLQRAVVPEASTTEAPVVEITEANFLDRTADHYTVVDFWAPWCAPCTTYRPVFHEAARRLGDAATFGSCNVDEHPFARELLQIASIPTTVVFGPDGSELSRVTGVMTLDQLTGMVRHVEQLRDAHS